MKPILHCKDFQNTRFKNKIECGYQELQLIGTRHEEENAKSRENPCEQTQIPRGFASFRHSRHQYKFAGCEIVRFGSVVQFARDRTRELPPADFNIRVHQKKCAANVCNTTE